MPVPIYQQSAPPTSTSTVPSVNGNSWQNPNRIMVDDGSSATLTMNNLDTGAVISGTGFTFPTLPDGVVLDGIAVNIEGTNTGGYGTVALNIPGTSTKDASTLNKSYGGVDDFWGLSSLTMADLTGLQVSVTLSDVLGGGDTNATMDYMSVTIYFHIDVDQTPDPSVPTSFIYRAYSKDGTYLGDLPNVTSPFSFSQDKNSAGSLLTTTCAVSAQPVTTTEAILDNNGDPIQTDASLDILARSTYYPLLPGSSDEVALFKNGNRLKVWMYNRWWPNGKLMFSGQVNRINFSIGDTEQVTVLTYSDGMDLDNYIARGYPFVYTPDQEQVTRNAYVFLSGTYGTGGWKYYGQTFTTGVSTNNVGEVQIMLEGTGVVTVSVYEGVNSGNRLSSLTKQVNGATFSSATAFAFPVPADVLPSTQYFFTVAIADGQDMNLGVQYPTGPYAGGNAYEGVWDGTGSPPPWAPAAYDLWFKTGIAVPTTTTTYSSQDPVSEMAAGIIADYNERGGRIYARDLTPAGYDLTYTFNSATIFAAIKKIIELAPAGYYSYVDLGTADIDILPVSSTADFTVVVGRDISRLDFSLTIERVENTLLFSGGEVTPGVNLFRQYQDADSAGRYDPRISMQSDNRVTLDATADAIGNSFIEENSDEVQETEVVLLNELVDITQYTPGKTIAFANTGTFVEEMVLQVVRRVFTENAVTLTVGKLPITQTAEIQRLNRGLFEQQTIANPDQPG